MATSVKTNRYGFVLWSFLLLFGAAGFAKAADVYHLEDNLYAIICVDGQIFSYQGSEDGLTIVVPALCEGHGGVANPGGGGVGANVAEAATGRPAQAVADRRAGARAEAAVSSAGTARAQGDSGQLWCWGRSCPAGVVAREIDKATPLLARSMAERCDADAGARRVQFREGSVLQCPLQRDARGQIVGSRSR
jgi:hypothetical protein